MAFRELDEWRRKEAPPALLITGEPGIGKSAIVAALVHENPEGQVLAYHCCRADTPATLEPAGFVSSLAGMLAARLEDYAAMLEDPGIKGTLERADTDPASAFETAILSPLQSVPKTAGDGRYLLIDALDEALCTPNGPPLSRCLPRALIGCHPGLASLPPHAASPACLRQLRGLSAQALKAEDPLNQNDVRAFLEDRLSDAGLRERSRLATRRSLILRWILTIQCWQFPVRYHCIDAVEGSQLSLDDLESLPPGRLKSV